MTDTLLSLFPLFPSFVPSFLPSLRTPNSTAENRTLFTWTQPTAVAARIVVVAFYFPVVGVGCTRFGCRGEMEEFNWLLWLLLLWLVLVWILSPIVLHRTAHASLSFFFCND